MGSFFKRNNGEDTSAEKAKEAAKEELSPDETEKRIREILSGEDKNTAKSRENSSRQGLSTGCSCSPRRAASQVR